MSFDVDIAQAEMMGKVPAARPAAQVSPQTAAADGYAAETFDYLSAWTSTALLVNAWPSGKVGLTRLILPENLSSLNGFLSCNWRLMNGGSPANCFLGCYTISGTNLVRQWKSSDQTLTATQLLRINMGLTSFDAGSVFFAYLAGTQSTTAGGPAISAAGSTVGNIARGSFGATVGRAGQFGTGLTDLPTSIPMASVALATYSFGWFAID
jgi:hypothetical protein